MAITDPLPFRDPSLPAAVEDFAPAAAWAAHLAAGRIGAAAPPLPPALGWRSAAGRFTSLPDPAPGSDGASASSSCAPADPAGDA